MYYLTKEKSTAPALCARISSTPTENPKSQKMKYNEERTTLSNVE